MKPTEFWKLTFFEFWSLWDYWNPPKDELKRSDLEELMRKFPDEVKG